MALTILTVLISITLVYRILRVLLRALLTDAYLYTKKNPAYAWTPLAKWLIVRVRLSKRILQEVFRMFETILTLILGVLIFYTALRSIVSLLLIEAENYMHSQGGYKWTPLAQLLYTLFVNQEKYNMKNTDIFCMLTDRLVTVESILFASLVSTVLVCWMLYVSLSLLFLSVNNYLEHNPDYQMTPLSRWIIEHLL